MKNILIPFLAILFIFSCKAPCDVVRKVNKEHFNSAPPGTVWIKDSIYIDKCEIRNLDYLEYTNWLKVYEPINYEKALPDSLVWRDSLSSNEPYVRYYFTHPAYRNFPLVGVSYEQALAYCKWRTDRVKEFIKLRKHSNTIEKIFHAKDFYYRLPSQAEWEYAASAGLNSIYGFESMHTKNNWPNFNVKETALLGYANHDVTVPCFYAKPNKFGLYNTIGNVAEMIQDKGVCKGGSWFHSIESCEIKSALKYVKPTAWIGFRCVCVVVK